MANDWPGLPYLARRLKDLPGDTPVAVYPWIPADAESSGMVPGYLIAASRIDLAGVELPTDDEPTTPPPPPPPPPPDPQIETWFVAVAKGQTLRLRSGAGTTFPVIGQLARGTELKIRGRFFVNDVTWTEVLEPVQGFTAADYLSLVHPDPAPPVVETETRYATGAGLRVRSAPDAKSEILDVLDFAEAITVKKGALVDGANGDTNKWRVRTTPSQGYVADQYLSLERPKVDAPPEPPPSAGQKWKFGLHIHQGSPNPNWSHDQVVRIARSGRLRGAVVINDVDLANRIYQAGCPHVVIRPVFGEGDTHPPLSGTDSDITLGKIWYKGNATQDLHNRSDKAVIIQPYGCNERNHTNDGYFYLGMMQEADKQGRKLGIFGDGVGHPADFKEWPEKSGFFISPAWDHRVSSGAARYAKEHGHIYIYHGYGRMTPEQKETSDPGSALWLDDQMKIIRRDDGAWFWYGGRHLSYYSVMKQNGQPLVPAHSRMLVGLGESGPSDAIWLGPLVFIKDRWGYYIRLQNDGFTLFEAGWTIGGGPTPEPDGKGLYRFYYSMIDHGLEQIADWAISVPILA